MADRGVSDVVGFVFVFAIIVSMVGLVYVTGVSGLENVRDFERLNNAERAFEVLGDNVEDLTMRGAPSRATEIKLADAQLRVGSPTIVNVSGERYGQPDENFTYEFGVEPIVYDAGTGTSIVYVNGAIIREERTGAVMVHQPNLLLSADRTVIPVVQTRGLASPAVGGSTTVLVRTERADSSLLTAKTEATYNVTLNVTSGSTARADAWERYLEARPDVTCADTGDPLFVSCSVTDTETVYVTLVRIDVTFE